MERAGCLKNKKIVKSGDRKKLEVLHMNGFVKGKRR